MGGGVERIGNETTSRTGGTRGMRGTRGGGVARGDGATSGGGAMTDNGRNERAMRV